MKKYLVLALVLSVMASFVTACGDDKPSGNDPAVTNSPQTTQGAPADNADTSADEPAQNTQADTEKPSDTSGDKLVNNMGDEFKVNTTVTGEIKKDAAPADGKTVVIDGKTYEFPMKVSDLMDNGWKVPDTLEFDNNFESNTETSVIGLYLESTDGSKINIHHIYNDSSETKELKDCIVTWFSITVDECSDGFEFVAPGGISGKSTAADVLSVYGNPNTTTEFSYGLNLEMSLHYHQHKTTNNHIQFNFNEDGTLYSFGMDCPDLY